MNFKKLLLLGVTFCFGVSSSDAKDPQVGPQVNPQVDPLDALNIAVNEIAGANADGKDLFVFGREYFAAHFDYCPSLLCFVPVVTFAVTYSALTRLLENKLDVAKFSALTAVIATYSVKKFFEVEAVDPNVCDQNQDIIENAVNNLPDYLPFGGVDPYPSYSTTNEVPFYPPADEIPFYPPVYLPTDEANIYPSVDEVPPYHPADEAPIYLPVDEVPPYPMV